MRLNDEQRQLAEDNIKLVYSIMWKSFKMPKGGEWDDYFQQGCLGLLKAAYYFDPSLGYKFSTYAIPMILGEMKRYKRDYGTHHDMFKYPRVTRNEINAALEDALDMEIDPRDYNKFLVDLDGDVTLKKNGESMSISEVIADVKSSMEALDDTEAWEVIGNAITRTINRISHTTIYDGGDYRVDIFEEYIYSLIYGGEKLTQIYFAEKYGVSQGQVSRLIRQGLKFLKYYYDLECNGIG